MEKRRSIAVACVVALLGTAWITAQQPQPPPSFRSGVELVMVDVGVIDRQGQPVKGLKVGDFTATVGGVPRPVVSAEFVGMGRSAPGTQPIVPVSTNEGGGVGQLFLFVLDQGSLDGASGRTVAAAAASFFARLTPVDRSSLVILPVGQGVPFTWAHDRVQQALLQAGGLAGRTASWDYGSLAEAREISNKNMSTLHAVWERECGGAAGSTGTATQGGTGSGTGGGAGGGTGGAGRGGTPPGGGGIGGGGVEPGFDACARTLEMQADSAWREAENTSLSTLAALRQALIELSRVQGDKTVILISGGWPLNDRDDVSTISELARQAANARATLFTLFVPRNAVAADRRSTSSTPTRDQLIQSGPLEMAAAMTGGAYYRADVGAQGVFERLGRELAGFYRIGIQRDATDTDGKARRLKVQVARAGVTVRAREIFDVRTFEDRDWSARLATALDAPLPATGVALRMTSYLAADPQDASHVKLTLVGEASRMQPGDVTFQLLLRDLGGGRVTTAEQPLGEAGADGALPFTTDISVPQGTYIARFAVIDSAGHVGSIDHRVDARPLAAGSVSALGPVLIRVPASADVQPGLALDTVRQDDRLALGVDLQGDAGGLSGTRVEFSISASPDGPALVRSTPMVSPGSRAGVASAQAVADVRFLPPGTYFARAKVSVAGQASTDLQRPFIVVAAAAAPAGGDAAGTARRPSGTMAASLMHVVPPFAVEDVLAPGVRNQFIDRVAARPDAGSQEVQELLSRARGEKLEEVVVSGDLATKEAAGAFVSGLTLLAQHKFNPAAEAFRTAMRVSPDFYPAMVYLGACYAAGGKDREATAVWRTALIRQGDAPALHGLLADALLRERIGDQALATIEKARARWPDDDSLKRTYVVAALTQGESRNGLAALDDLIAAKKDDEASLMLGLVALYEAVTKERPIESAEADRAHMVRLADAYRARGGASQALVDMWLAAVSKKD